MTKLQTSDGGEFARFPWEHAYVMWGMHRLRTCTKWVDSSGLEHGEDRKWLKLN